MPFPVASGVTTPPIYPTGSAGNGLSGTAFIPEIWSGKLIEKFYASTVLAAISNTDYEGEVAGLGAGEILEVTSAGQAVPLAGDDLAVDYIAGIRRGDVAKRGQFGTHSWAHWSCEPSSKSWP